MWNDWWRVSQSYAFLFMVVVGNMMRQLENQKDLMCSYWGTQTLDLHGFSQVGFLETVMPQKHVVLNRHSESVWLAVPMALCWVDVTIRDLQTWSPFGSLLWRYASIGAPVPRPVMVSDWWSTSCSRSCHYLPGTVMLATLPSLTWGAWDVLFFLLHLDTLTNAWGGTSESSFPVEP